MIHDHGITRPTGDVGLLMIRIMLAVVFMFHGSQKLFGMFGGSGIEGFSKFLGSIGVPYPTLAAYLAGGAEFFGGLALLLGIGLPIAAAFLCTTMLVASFKVHGGAFSGQNGGMEYPLTLAVVTAGLALVGPGRLAVPIHRKHHAGEDRHKMHVGSEHHPQTH